MHRLVKREVWTIPSMLLQAFRAEVKALSSDIALRDISACCVLAALSLRAISLLNPLTLALYASSSIDRAARDFWLAEAAV